MTGPRVFECNTTLRSGRDVTEVLSEAWGQRAEIVALPVKCLDDDFFRLRSGVAGEILQKFVTYKMRVAIVGDISGYVEESTALRDFVYETNRGDQVWFVPTMEELGERLRTL